MSDYSSILVHSSCLSKVQLLAYVQQKLDREEMYLVESHICDCQFCNDALDGLMEANMEQVERDLITAKAEMHKKLFPVIISDGIPISKESNIREFEISKKTFTRWLAAASVLLLIGLGGYSVFSYIKSSQKKELSLNEKGTSDKSYDAKYSKNENEHDEIVRVNVAENDTFRKYADEPAKLSKKNIAIEATTEEKKPILLEDKKENRIITADENKTPAATDREVEKALAPAPIAANAKSAEEDIAKIEAAPDMDNYASVNRREKVPAVATKEVARKKSGGGMRNNQSNNAASNQLAYPKAANNDDNLERNVQQYLGQRNEVLAKEESSPRTNFEKGMDYFNSKNYKKSISLFEKALKKAVGDEKENILYHLALAYEYTGKNQKAAELYTALSRSKKYSEDAERKLQEVQNKDAQKKK